MPEQPTIFDLGVRPPTTRTIALKIKHEGPAAAIDEAQRRADAASYQEITCRSALNPVKGMPFNWTLNPYRGCTHACHYCFARRYQTQFGLGPARVVFSREPGGGISEVHVDFFSPSLEKRSAATNPRLWVNAAAAVAMTAIAVRRHRRRHKGVRT